MVLYLHNTTGAYLGGNHSWQDILLTFPPVCQSKQAFAGRAVHDILYSCPDAVSQLVSMCTRWGAIVSQGSVGLRIYFILEDLYSEALVASVTNYHTMSSSLLIILRQRGHGEQK